MNPRLLLALWRERWGKAAETIPATPYLQGPPNLWGGRLARAAGWSLPGVVVVTSLICCLLFAFLLSIRFSLSSQIVFSVFFVCVALYLRRYAGTFVTLVLLGLAFIVSTRYLYWRFSATLVQNINLDFLLGFCLCLAEAHLWLLTILGSVQSVWPLKQARAALPGEPAVWPTVDVFIPCAGQPLDAIESSAMAALALDWPRNKLKTYILDDRHRDDVKALADAMGAGYLAQPENSKGTAGQINLALAQTDGELIALFDCDRTPPADFLQMTVGWFVRDTKLGMLQTPQHFLAPAPSQCSLQIISRPDLAGSCAVLRRAMVIEMGGVQTEPVSGRMHTALKLQALGHGTAYIGFAERAPQSGARQTASVERQTRTALEVFRMDDPFGDKSLLWKLRLTSLKAELQFYYPVARLIFYTAPLAYLLLNAHIIKTSVELLAAYALPHLILGHISRQRMQDKHRFSLFADIRETLFAWYLLLRTAITVTGTEFASRLNANKTGKAEKNLALDLRTAFPYVIVFGLNLAGLVAGAIRLQLSHTSEPGLIVFFLLWAAYNIMVLAAMLAVAEEGRDIRRHTHSQARIPAMIRMPSGHTVSCMTENFPEIALALKLPAPVTIETGLVANISLFYGNREFSFPAQLVQERDRVLRASFDGAAQNVYRVLRAAAYSRGQDWPKWLPGRDADRLFPVLIPKALVAVRDMVPGFATHFGRFARPARFSSWMHLWKNKK